MIVMREAAGWQRGDTVRVDLADISETLAVPNVGASRTGARIPLDALGPIGTDTMVVTADRPNVRRCRSRGCSVLGYVARGQLVQVDDFIGGWFRFTGDDGARGYIHSDHLETRTFYRRRLLDETRQRTAAYFEESLASRRTNGGDRLFSGHEVRFEDGMLSFAFYTAYSSGGELVGICDAMRGIDGFVESSMARVPPGILEAYSVGVYAGARDGEAGEMVAGPSGDGGVYCKEPG